MELDETEPRKPAIRLTPLPLGPLGIAELQSYIAELRLEIERTEMEITRKQAHRTSADRFFRNPATD